VRIVAGEWRGRIIAAPAGRAVRPTTDRVREAWMSIVNSALPGARVLDLFAGSGALGLEALSRGAVHATFVEDGPRALRALHDNIDALGASDRARIVRGDAVRFAAGLAALPGLAGTSELAFDVAFADPPYATGLARAIAEQWLTTPFARLLGVEHDSRDTLPSGDTRRYGDTAITFFRL
jgi:16S rRNA (guanine966-N2)-methyltransferase